MSPAPALWLLILSCVLPVGHASIMRSYSPPLKTSSFAMTEDICSDCTKIIELFSNILSEPEPQEFIKLALHQICERLPSGSTLDECEEFIQRYLPVILQNLIKFTVHNEGEICMVLGLCAAQPEHKAPELPSVGLQGDGFTQMQPLRGTNHELQASPQCTFCLFLFKKLEDMLPKERTEESVVKLLDKICDYLPSHYKEQCNNLIEKYAKQIIDFLLSSATPHAICMLLHLCLVQDAPVPVPFQPSDCKTCKVLMILTQTHLGQNSSETQMISSLWKTCRLHPNALPKCELFIQSHATALVNILSKQEEAVNACQKFFCVGHE